VTRYLLRIDDVCPTMDRGKWSMLERVASECGIRPILAVVPDNRDPKLSFSPADPHFWSKVRLWQNRGWTIGLHGYQHTREGAGVSLAPHKGPSEFAGLPLDQQRAKIEAGLSIMRSQGLRPSIWVAPRHGFDANTLVALREVGLLAISDGFALHPHCEDGFFWVPVQLWRGQRKPFGVWTICVHPGTASHLELARLERFIRRHAAAFSTLDRLHGDYGCRRATGLDRIFSVYWRKQRALRARAAALRDRCLRAAAWAHVG